MECTIRPGTIDLLCRDQEFIPNQQKSTPKTTAKKEGWWSRSKRYIKNMWKNARHMISTITDVLSAFTGILIAYNKCKLTFASCH